MVGLVDAMAELRASQERASPAKAARAAAERLATFCGNDHYFEDGHDDPIGQPVVTPATRRAGARVEERLPSDQAARVDGGADALDRIPGERVLLGPGAVEGCVDGAGRPTGPSATAGVGKHEAEVRIVVDGVQRLRQPRQCGFQVLDHPGRLDGRAGTEPASHHRDVVARPRPATPSSVGPLGGGGCRMPRSHDMWSGEDLG